MSGSGIGYSSTGKNIGEGGICIDIYIHIPKLSADSVKGPRTSQYIQRRICVDHIIWVEAVLDIAPQERILVREAFAQIFIFPFRNYLLIQLRVLALPGTYRNKSVLTVLFEWKRYWI